MNKLKRVHSKNSKEQSSAKRQSRNNHEKRRRDLFNQLITDLGDVLSVNKSSSSNDQNNKLDKSSILRQTVLYLQKHQQYLTAETNFISSDTNCMPPREKDIVELSWKPPSDIINTEEWLQIVIEAMHCCFLVVKADQLGSKIVYVSNNITSYLGYSQDELVHHSLFEFIHPTDHDRLNNYLLNNHKILENCDVSWKRFVSDDYEQSTIIGAFRNRNENENYFMSIVQFNTLDRTLINHHEHSFEQFSTHLDKSGRFIYIDSKARELLGYSSFELIGQTHFDFVHPDDLPIIARAHQLWKQNGNGQSDPYRFLTKGQQWIFVQTYSQVKLNSWTGKPETYICTTSFVECYTNSLQKQLPIIPTNIQSGNSNVRPTTTAEISQPTNRQERSPGLENEISSFLSNLESETYRKHVRQKLVNCQKTKETEVCLLQEEIRAIEDLLQYLNQYEAKHVLSSSSSNEHIQQTKNILSDDSGMNLFDLNCDLTLFDSPLTETIEDCPCQTNSEDGTINDPFESIFSPLSTSCYFSSLITPLSNPSSNNDITQDIDYLTPSNNSSAQRSSSQNPFT